MQTETHWINKHTSSIDFGDRRRNNSVAQLLDGIATRPHGVVYNTFLEEKKQHAAYRILSNKHFDHQRLIDISARRVAEEAKGHKYLVVPVDPSSISLSDPSLNREIGKTGNARHKNGRGLIVSSAIALKPDGVPVGVLAQKYWIRKPKRKSKERSRKIRKDEFQKKETYTWVQLASESRRRLNEFNCSVPLWFQFDRGGDCHDILDWLADLQDDWVTVRLTHNRKVDTNLWQTTRCSLCLSGPSATGILKLPKNGNNPDRKILVDIYFEKIPIQLKEKDKKKPYRSVELNIVQVRSRGANEGEIDWLLVTNYPIKSMRDVLTVVENYSLRWRIEEVHRTWKGILGLEDNRLESFESIARWAILKVIMAMRIEELKKTAVSEPNRPALELLTRSELEAICLLKHKREINIETITVGDAVLWLGQLGGYSRPSSSGGHPPGAKVISRGFERVSTLAEMIEEGYQFIPPD